MKIFLLIYKKFVKSFLVLSKCILFTFKLIIIYGVMRDKFVTYIITVENKILVGLLIVRRC
jgi:hypothetical protein